MPSKADFDSSCMTGLAIKPMQGADMQRYPYTWGACQLTIVELCWLLQGKSGVDLAWETFHATQIYDYKTIAMHLQHLVGQDRIP